MQKQRIVSSYSEGASVRVSEVERHAKGWLLDGQIRQFSRATLAAREFLVGKLVWFLKHREYEHCGLPEIRVFQVRTGSPSGGRHSSDSPAPRCSRRRGSVGAISASSLMRSTTRSRAGGLRKPGQSHDSLGRRSAMIERDLIPSMI